MKDKRYKELWTKERWIKYYERKLREMDVKIMELQSRRNGYSYELNKIRYEK
jgi:hypothetical protein